MPQKPSPKTILSTHTLSDLLDLIKVKAAMDYQESLTALQSQIQNIASNIDSSSPSKPSKPTPTTKPPKKPTSKKRARNKQPVGDMILSVLSSTPMNINDILKAIQSNGFKTSSKNPKQIISLQLMKLSQDKKVQKAGRGMYVLSGSDGLGKKASKSKGTMKKSTKKKSTAKSQSKTAEKAQKPKKKTTAKPKNKSTSSKKSTVKKG